METIYRNTCLSHRGTSTAKILHERDVVFIDLRIRSFFDGGHFPGVINIPINHLNNNTLTEVASKDQEIVIYCYGIHCDYSNQASNRARTWGYRKVYYFMKGYRLAGCRLSD